MGYHVGCFFNDFCCMMWGGVCVSGRGWLWVGMGRCFFLFLKKTVPFWFYLSLLTKLLCQLLFMLWILIFLITVDIIHFVQVMNSVDWQEKKERSWWFSYCKGQGIVPIRCGSFSCGVLPFTSFYVSIFLMFSAPWLWFSWPALYYFSPPPAPSTGAWIKMGKKSSK